MVEIEKSPVLTLSPKSGLMLQDWRRQGGVSMVSPPLSLYEGEYVNGRRHGRGTQTWADGSLYEGDYENGKRHGNGIHKWKNGERYEGSYVEDTRHGKGAYSWPNGAKYEGDFIRDKKEGKGTFLLPSGNWFEGLYKNDERLGFGVLTYIDETQDVGEWKGARLTRISTRIELANAACLAFDGRGIQRGAKGAKGSLELASEELIRSAGDGDVIGVQSLLERGDVDVDVADGCGNTSLIAASIHCHLDVITVLLDSGADINRINDCGLSALSALFHLLYTGREGSEGLSEAKVTVRLAVPQKWRPLDLTDVKAMDRLHSVTDGRSSLGYYSSLTGRRSPTAELARNAADEERRCESEMERERSDSALTESENEDIINCQNDKQEGVMVVYSGRSPANLRSAIKLLLSRGADSNRPSLAMSKPMAMALPPLFHAVKVKDIVMLKLLLKEGALTTIQLPPEDGGETALHVASGLSGRRTLRVLQILLKAGADPNGRQLSVSGADPYRCLQQRRVSIQTTNSMTSGSADDESLVPGQTPLHVACARLGDPQTSFQIADALLQRGADPNLVAYGHSPLSLAIDTGNDKVAGLLLKAGADPNLPLGCGIGSALCAVAALHSQKRRSPQASIELIDRLMSFGADIFMTVAISPRLSSGTAVDYAHWAFNRDRHISTLPYKALTKDERVIYNGRMKILNHIASVLRNKANEKEAHRLTRLNKEASQKKADELGEPSAGDLAADATNETLGRGHSISTISELALEEAKEHPPPRSPMFTTRINAGKRTKGRRLTLGIPQEVAGSVFFSRPLRLPQLNRSGAMKRSVSVGVVDRHMERFRRERGVPFARSASEWFHLEPCRENRPMSCEGAGSLREEVLATPAELSQEFRFCNHCGKSSGVKLVLCQRCQRAFYCSRTCKKKGWETRHKHECIKI
eukprot:m.5968 g.5968  ORF g.5968 m.5968 type:complete len:926 (+) comp14594_c0_seq1:56-2833(+)